MLSYALAASTMRSPGAVVVSEGVLTVDELPDADPLTSRGEDEATPVYSMASVPTWVVPADMLTVMAAAPPVLA